MLTFERKDRIGFIGNTGSGKTEELKRELSRLMSVPRRVVAFDWKDELSIQGRPRRHTVVGPLSYKWTSRQFFAQPNILATPSLRLSIVPDEPLDKHLCALTVKRILEQLRAVHMDGGDPETVLVLEEVGHYAGYRHTKNGRVLWSMAEWLTDGAKIWRDYGVCIVYVSPRAVDIPIGARSQINQFVSFAQSEPADIEALRERTGLSDPTYAERVALLSPTSHDYQVWQLGAVVAVPTQHSPEKDNGDGKRDGQPADKERAHQDGNRGGRDSLHPGEDQRGKGRDGDALQNRPVPQPQAAVHAAQDLAAPAAPSDKPSDGAAVSSPVRQKAAAKKKPKQVDAIPPPQTKEQRTKSRRRTRAA